MRDVRPIKEKEKEIVDFLRDNGGKTRQQISDKLGIPRTTLYDIMAPLVARGILEKLVGNSHKRGTKPFLWRLAK